MGSLYLQKNIFTSPMHQKKLSLHRGKPDASKQHPMPECLGASAPQRVSLPVDTIVHSHNARAAGYNSDVAQCHVLNLSGQHCSNGKTSLMVQLIPAGLSACRKTQKRRPTPLSVQSPSRLNEIEALCSGHSACAVSNTPDP